MKLALFGATGFTGRVVLEEALARDHDVVALVRDPSTLGIRHDRLTIVRGNALDPQDVDACLADVDAVVHCLGVGGKGDGRPTTLVSDSVAVVLKAMQTHDVRRIVCMSNVGAGGSGPWLVNRVIVPMFVRWLVPLVEDKDRMEALLRTSSAEWISVRLPGIEPGPAKPIKTSDDGKGLSMSITAGSVAAFMLDAVDSDAFVRRTPSVSN